MIGNMLYRFNGQKWSSNIRYIHTNMEVNHHTFTCNDKSVAFTVFDSDNQNEKAEYLIIIYRLTCGPIRILCECKQRHFNPSLDDTVIFQKELYSIELFKAIDILADSVIIEFEDDISVNIVYKPFQITVLKTSTLTKLLSINSHSMLSIGINSVDFTYYSNDENPVRLMGLPARDSHVFLIPTINESKQNTEIKGDPYRIFNCDTGGFRPPKEFSIFCNQKTRRFCIQIVLTLLSILFITLTHQKIKLMLTFCQNLDRLIYFYSLETD